LNSKTAKVNCHPVKLNGIYHDTFIEHGCRPSI
jgi:hypothetical protein